MIIQDRIGKYLQPGRAWYTRDVSTIKVFSIHHDAIPQDNRTADQVMAAIYAGHKANGWPGMSYAYYIHRDGTVYQVNKHEWVTWVDGINWDCIGIVVNGYFHTPNNNEPNTPQLIALKELLDELSTNHPEFPADQSGVYGHRERAATSCPGDKLFPYVKEYREKLGDVNWGTTPIPTPINDQTKIPANLLNSVDFPVTNPMEIQAIRGTLGDYGRAKKELIGVKDQLTKIQNELEIVKAKLKEINTISTL